MRIEQVDWNQETRTRNQETEPGTRKQDDKKKAILEPRTSNLEPALPPLNFIPVSRLYPRKFR